MFQALRSRFSKVYHHKWFPRVFYKKYDGGVESGVTGYMLIEWKPLLSIGILHFAEGSREAYHSHAFHALTWWLKGRVTEVTYCDRPDIGKRQGELTKRPYSPSLIPKITKRQKFHKVVAHRDTWAFTVRGPWEDTWHEIRNKEKITLTHGRQLV